MRKIIFFTPYLIFFIILLVIFNLFINKKKTDEFANYKKIKYQLKNKNYHLLVADSEEKRAKGLMNVRDLKIYDGMIFIFEDKNFQSFWNKNTFLDLDVYWLEDDKIIGIDFLPSIEKSKNIMIINSPKKVNKVIEIVKD